MLPKSKISVAICLKICYNVSNIMENGHLRAVVSRVPLFLGRIGPEPWAAKEEISMSKSKTVIPEEGIFDARQLGIPKMLLLGLQHMFAMFGATVLVPLILANQYGLPMSNQTTLFCAGIVTLLFHVLTKFKVPAFLGSSFAFLGGFQAVSELDTGIFADMTGDEKLPYALGGVVIAGLLYLVLALIIKLVGVKRVMRFLPPVVTGPIIIAIGLILASSAGDNASTCWWLAGLSLLTIIICNIWGKGMIKIIPILLGVLIPYAVVLILSLCGVISPESGAYVSFEAVKSAKIVGLQPFMLPKFDLTAILVMAPIAIATMMEHVGDISAISATTKKNFVHDPGLHRTLLGDGLATSLSALIGGPANTTYGENTGVLALSRVYDPNVVRIAAVFAIILSFSPMFDQIICSIPTAIIGGVSFILYGMISAIGVRNVVENQVDLSKSRNVIIAAVILVSALGFSDGLSFTIAGTTVTLTSLAIAAILGIVLNAVLPGKDYQFNDETPNPSKPSDPLTVLGDD